MKIEWTEPALVDIENIKNYIKQDSEYYANRFVGKIIEAVESLQKFHKRGRHVIETENESIRELLFYNYRIIYNIEKDRISVLTIIHGSRNLKQKDLKPWDVV